MKIKFLVAAMLLFVTINCFSQATKIKQAEQKKASTLTPTAVINPIVKQDSLAKASSETQPKTTIVSHAIEQKTTTKASTVPVKTVQSNNTQNMNIKVDSSKANLLDGFFKILIGLDNKDGDTHWSCGLFDQNNRPILSFHDDNNTDEYKEDSWTQALKMSMDNAATFGDFANGGHIHINITPNGHDTWKIGLFDLTLDFLNPKFTKTFHLYPGTLSQEVRDVDLYFYYDGTNFVAR